MDSKPKSINEALDRLEGAASNGASELKGRLKEELAKIEKALEDLKPQLSEIQARVETEARKGKDAVEEQVRKHPWTAIGIVAVIAFLLGLLVRSGSRGRD